jgi:hypothetical protein
MLETPMYPLVLAIFSSNNPRGADNQQERFLRVKMEQHIKKIPTDIGYYLAGFADGEGSFNVSFRLRKDYTMPWKISLCFNVSQRDKVILALYKRWMKCGTLRSRPDGVWYFEVNNFTAITQNVIPFFNRFGFLSAKKKRDFSKFKEISRLIGEGNHLNKEGIIKILAIRNEMNDGGAGHRKYDDRQILQVFEGKSPETTRQADSGH